jgi:Asp-tRNA(Asn)/Glu-tRNA(Gln) amidotransferase A subunit family amidase
MPRAAVLTAFLVTVAFAAPAVSQAQPVPVEETTIAVVHAAMRERRLTCRALVETYLRRIAAYDKNGPALNAIVLTNPRALDEADSLDARFKQGGLGGSLHCVPMIVKDNFETIGLQSANGSLALEGFVSSKDAFQVKRVKEAGAIVLAKSNMAEWAFSPYETINSILPGYSKNPYALDRVTAGSSGGTAAAVASNFGLIGLGSDTGNSIRGPSSHQALVGIRSTMGLTSRAGVMPLNLLADIAGPMGRTVEDVAAVFQVIAGEDPDDPATAVARGRPPVDYRAALQRDGLEGARIGVLRQAYVRSTAGPAAAGTTPPADTTDSEIASVFASAIADLERAGATIVDPATVEGLETIRRPQGIGPCMGFKYDINNYLASHGERVPVKTLADIIKSGRFHPTVQRRLEQAEQGPANGPDTPECQTDVSYREQVRQAVLKTMDALKLDAFVYPTWSNPPRLIGDLNSPHGDNSQFFSPTTGFPAIQVPMGYTRGAALPAGMTIYGRPWSEAMLFKLAYAYEQATRHRRPPASAPPLHSRPLPRSDPGRRRLATRPVRGEHLRELLANFRVRGIVGQVPSLVRVLLHIEQLGAFRAGVPLDVPIALGAHRIAIADLRERVRLDRRGRVFEQRPQARALDLSGWRQPGQVGSGAIQIDELGKPPCGTAPSRDARRGNDERYSSASFEQRRLLPQSVIAEVVSMIAGKDDNGAIGEADPLERAQHDADLRIHEAD